MCGRYSFFTPIPDIELRLGVRAVEWAEWHARYNAAPTMAMPVITNEFPGIIQFFRWGLVPKWAADISIGNKMINTRTESIIEKPSFRNIFKYKRCIVLADGYFEWKVLENDATAKSRKPAKQPYRLCAADNKTLLIAGLWDTWKGELNSFSIITCPASAELADIHDRMPVILSEADARRWLSNEIAPDSLLALLKPAPHGSVRFYPIGTDVNKPVNDFPEIIEPITP